MSQRISSRLIRVVVLLGLFALAGCSRTGEGFPGTLEDDDTSSGSDSGVDTGTGDVGGGEDADPVEDAGNPEPDVFEDVGEPDVPPVETPERSAELDLLYCGLDNGGLVAAGLRAAACLDVPFAGVLEDATRGFVHGELLQHGYVPATYGNCDYLLCLALAENCADAQECEDQRVGEECENSYGRRCDGNTLEECIWDREREQYRWYRVQDCGRMNAMCVDEPCDGPDCFNEAQCVTSGVDAECGYYGSCDGDTMIRCSNAFSFDDSGVVEIPCNELIAGGTCIETAVGGEAPGPACVAEDRECANNFQEGFECDGQTLQYCLYGRLQRLDCVEYGYDSCTSEQFMGAHCE